MARPLTRAQQLENTAFLRLLRIAANVRATYAALGRHRAPPREIPRLCHRVGRRPGDRARRHSINTLIVAEAI